MRKKSEEEAPGILTPPSSPLPSSPLPSHPLPKERGKEDWKKLVFFSLSLSSFSVLHPLTLGYIQLCYQGDQMASLMRMTHFSLMHKSIINQVRLIGGTHLNNKYIRAGSLIFFLFTYIMCLHSGLKYECLSKFHLHLNNFPFSIFKLNIMA